MIEMPSDTTNRTDVDLSGTAQDSVTQLIECVDSLQKHPFRSHLPSDSIAIGPRTKGGKGMSLSERILHITSNDQQKVHSVDKGSSRDIFAEIVTHQNEIQEQIGIVLMSFFLHNFPEGERHRLLQSIGTMFPNAAVIVSDYILGDVSEEKVPLYLTSEFETEIVAKKGIEKFIKEHRCFTLQSLQKLLSMHFNFISAKPMKAARGLVIGHNQHVWEDNQISTLNTVNQSYFELIPAA